MLLFCFVLFCFLIIYLLAVLGLRFCARAFSSCGKRGPLSARASHYRGLSCCGAQAPDAQAQYLWLTGPVAPWQVGSSQTRARTCFPCIVRQPLNHCATKEAPMLLFLCTNKRKPREVYSIPRGPIADNLQSSY